MTRWSVNEVGCLPEEDVCSLHSQPLVCDHGCDSAKPHKCGPEMVEVGSDTPYTVVESQLKR